MISYLVKICLYFFDQLSQKKILIVLKKIFKKNIGYVIDVGAHQGETINFLVKNFKFNTIYAFEPNFESYQILKKRVNDMQKNIIIFNKGVGLKNEKKVLFNSGDSSSSTYCDINYNSNYYKRKKFLLDLVITKEKTQLLNLATFFKKKNIKKINYLKTDTEGYELDVIMGLYKYIKNIRIIHFEHHYDDMYKKKYTFADINNYLTKNNFHMVFKLKMFFRKSFEYIYENKRY